MAISEKMVAVDVQAPGGADMLSLKEVRTPYPGEGQYLVKVSAAGVNGPDLVQREGHYPAPKGESEILGLEVAGEIVICGRNTHRFQVGDQVCALVPGGGYAEYCLVEEGITLPVPKGLSVNEAAGIPETFFTVWHNIFERGALREGETLLVHGGASGIGVCAIQLGQVFGAEVLTTVSSAEKCKFCEALGAKRAINYLEENFVDLVKEITDRRGVDVILDMVGGDYIERNIKCAATDGRIVQIAFLNGAIAEVNFMRLMLKRLTLTGSTLRVRSLKFKEALAQAVEKNVWPLLEQGKVKPIIDKTFALKDVAEAHRYMESRQHMGKIILTV